MTIKGLVFGQSPPFFSENLNNSWHGCELIAVTGRCIKKISDFVFVLMKEGEQRKNTGKPLGGKDELKEINRNVEFTRGQHTL